MWADCRLRQSVPAPSRGRVGTPPPWLIKGRPCPAASPPFKITCIGWSGWSDSPICQHQSPPPFFCPSVCAGESVFFIWCKLIPYLNLSHYHLSLVSCTMCCLMSHAVSQSPLCVTYASCLTDVSVWLSHSLWTISPISVVPCLTCLNCLSLKLSHLPLWGDLVWLSHHAGLQKGLFRRETRL